MEEHLETSDREGPGTALTPVMEAATEREGDREVLTGGVQSETDRGGSETEIERGGGAAAETEKEKETETKVESKGRGVKTGRKGGAQEARSDQLETEGGNVPVHQSPLIAQGLIIGNVPPKKRRKGKTRRR